MKKGYPKKVILNVRKFCSDYFFHYLMRHSPRLRIAFCRFLSDESVQSTTLIQESYYGVEGESKKILDVPLKDDNDNIYNFEMENSYIGNSQLARFQIYVVKLIESQLSEKKKYGQVKPVRQLIIYTGKPIKNLEHVYHQMLMGDSRYQIIMNNGLFDIRFLQTQLMEEMNMDTHLQSRLSKFGLLGTMKLFSSEKAHEEGGTDELSREALDIYHQFIDQQQFLNYAAMERDRMVDEARMDDIKEYEHEQGLSEGIEIGELRGIEIGEARGIEIGEARGIEIGEARGIEIGEARGIALEHTRLLEEKKDNVKMLIQGIYQVDNLKWVDDCTEKELNKLFQYISNNISYEELKERMMNSGL